MLPPVYIQPSESLSGIVKNYIFLKNGNKDQGIYDKFIPDGYSALVFNFSSTVLCYQNDIFYSLPKLILTYPMMEFLSIEVPPGTDSMVVVFYTSVLTRLFNISLAQNDQYPFIDFSSFLNYPLWEQLSDLQSDNERIGFFENYLKTYVLKEKYIRDEIDDIYEKIIADEGKTNIRDILTEFSINPRSFRRKFLKRIGVSAKSLSRIVRVNYVWRCLSNLKSESILNIIYDSHFFDQSHFIRDFKKIVGEPPRAFLKRDLTKVKYISGRDY